MSTIVVEKSDLQSIIDEAVNKAVTHQIPEIIREATKKKWLTREEVKDLTGWSYRTLQHLRDTEQIPYSQHGRKILYPTDGIEKFLLDNQVTPRK